MRITFGRLPSFCHTNGIMTYHTHKAKEFFDDAKNHMRPEKDPVMWNTLNGLSELSDAVQKLSSDIDAVKQLVEIVKSRIS